MNWPPVLLAVLIVGCGSTVSRPDQDNFTIHASKQRVAQLIQNLSRRFDASADAHDLDGIGNDPSRMFRLDGADATLIIIPVGDDRCNTNAPRHLTFKQGEYRIDLVYRTASAAARNTARQLLAHSVQDADLTMAKFKECPR